MVVIPFGCSYTEDHCIGDLELGIDGVHDLRDGFRLLVAKVGAYLRRVRSHSIRRGIYQVGAVELDDDAHEVTISGRPVTLSAKPFAILAVLMQEPSRVFSRNELIDRIWGQGFSVGEHTLDVHIHAIRKELNREPNRLCDLITIKRVGFKLKPAPSTGAIRARRSRPTFTSIPGSDTRSTRTPRLTPRFGRVINLGSLPDPPRTSPTTTCMTSACG
jgi:DNA-binding winged helix-turn-helix (wHTH) protein